MLKWIGKKRVLDDIIHYKISILLHFFCALFSTNDDSAVFICFHLLSGKSKSSIIDSFVSFHWLYSCLCWTFFLLFLSLDYYSSFDTMQNVFDYSKVAEKKLNEETSQHITASHFTVKQQAKKIWRKWMHISVKWST